LQIYLKLWIDDFQAVVPDKVDIDVDIFSLFVKDFELVSDKMSNYVCAVTYKATDFSSRLGDKLGISDKYLDFIRLPRPSSGVDLLELNPFGGVSTPAKPFSGQMKVTPDSKKEIEFLYEKANLVVFDFMVRFIVELLSIDDAPQHPGFENVYSTINFQLRIKEAEVCLLSGKESCLVAKCKLGLMQAS
jgi:hypothetical protein